MMSEFDEFKTAEFKGWSEKKTASAYAVGFATATAMCVPEFVRLADAEVGKRCLDVCCGHGIIADGMTRAGADVTGLDFSPAMLGIAKRNFPKTKFIEGDATDLNFESCIFDAVTMGFGILHIPDSGKAISEAFRVLKPGGKFIYSVWHGPEISAAFRIVFGSLQKFGDPNVTLPPSPAIHEFADRGHALPILKQAGFLKTEFATVEAYWDVDDPGKPFDYISEGTVRGVLLLRSQPDKNAHAIRTEIQRLVMAEFGEQGPWNIPIPAAIVSSTK